MVLICSFAFIFASAALLIDGSFATPITTDSTSQTTNTQLNPVSSSIQVVPPNTSTTTIYGATTATNTTPLVGTTYTSATDTVDARTAMTSATSPAITPTPTIPTTTTPVPATTVSRSAQPSASGWPYFGCVSDSASSRTLKGRMTTTTTMTPEACVRVCKAGGYNAAGLEDGNVCYCDRVIKDDISALAIPDSSCNISCAGATQYICGSTNALTLYLERSR